MSRPKRLAIATGASLALFALALVVASNGLHGDGAPDSSGAKLSEGRHDIENRGSAVGIQARPFQPANRTNWDGRAWVERQDPELERLSRNPMDIYDEFQSDPERWLATEIWLNNRNSLREGIFACHEKLGDELTSRCKKRYSMVAERVPGRTDDEGRPVGRIVYVRPEVLKGSEDPSCLEMMECLGRVRLGAEMPVPPDVDHIAIEREQTTVPTPDMGEDEKRAKIEEMIGGLKESLQWYRSDPKPEDPSWIRATQVLQNSIEFWQWVLEQPR